MLEIESCGETVASRCVNCGSDDAVTAIMLTRTTGGTAIPEVAQKCRTCGQIGGDA